MPRPLTTLNPCPINPCKKKKHKTMSQSIVRGQTPDLRASTTGDFAPLTLELSPNPPSPPWTQNSVTNGRKNYMGNIRNTKKQRGIFLARNLNVQKIFFSIFSKFHSTQILKLVKTYNFYLKNFFLSAVLSELFWVTYKEKHIFGCKSLIIAFKKKL